MICAETSDGSIDEITGTQVIALQPTNPDAAVSKSCDWSISRIAASYENILSIAVLPVPPLRHHAIVAIGQPFSDTFYLQRWPSHRFERKPVPGLIRDGCRFA
jgi:hypothetical protein